MSEFLIVEAAGAKPKVSGLAYSGGKMALPGWKHPVVVDLAGMSVPDSVPLLTDHKNNTSSRVGMVSASVKDNTLEIAGEIISDSKDATDIVAQSKAGADWQLSIGAEVAECELVQGKREVNGQEQTGPFYHVKKSTLREVSVVAVGADSNTQMKVTASFNLKGEIEIMNEDQNKVLEADADIAVKAASAERERVVKIRSVCNGEFPKIEAQAVDEGWTPEFTGEKVLAAYRAKQPESSVNVVVKTHAPATRQTLEAAMCLRAGISGDALVKSYGEQVVEAAMPDMDISLHRLMVEAMRLEGMSVPRSFDNAAIHAAFSTVCLPGILSNVANKKLLQSYEAQPVIATKLCTTGDLNDFKENDRFRMTDVGNLLPVAADGEIKDGGFTEEGAKNQLETYGKKFCLTRKMIINDDLGAFMKVPQMMGGRAARLIDQLFFARLLANPLQSDGKVLFDNSHKNLLSGATSALSADSLKKASQKFIEQKDSDGQPINVEPRYLLVSPENKHLAIELTQSLMMVGGTTASPAFNSLTLDGLQVVVSPYLSGAAWYLFGNPQQVDTFEIGFLKGKRTPTVERGDLDFNVLGMWFRVYFDLGVREQDFRGMVKANGNA